MTRYIWVLMLTMVALIAESQLDTSVAIDQIEIIEERLTIPTAKKSRSVITISKEQIAAYPVQNVNELLQYFGGIDIRRRGINGVQADAGIRGGSFDQTLVIVDGVKMIDPQTGHHMMNIPVSINDIERVEIIKGSAAKIYGQNAMNGVILITTKNATDTEIEAQASYGSFGQFNTNLSFARAIGATSHRVSGSYNSSDGYRYNTDYQNRTLHYQGQASLNTSTQAQWNAGITDRKFGANAFYANENFKDQYEEVATSLATLRLKTTLQKIVLNYGVQYRRNRDMYLFLRDDPSFYRNRHLSQRYGADINATYYINSGAVGLGLEYYQEDLVSSNLGNYERALYGMYLDYRWDVTPRLFLHPGFYVNMFSDDKIYLFPGIDASYQWISSFSTFVSVNQSNRVPTYTDLYYTSPVEQGNPRLKNERSLSTEVGCSYRGDKMNASISAYLNQGQNLIDWYKTDTSQTQWVATNFKNINTRGLEWNISIPLHAQLNHRPLAYSLIYEGALIKSSPVGDVNGLSRYTLDHMSDQHIVKFQAKYHDIMTILVANRWIRRNAFEGNPQHNYSVLDASINARIWKVEAFVQANNLLNTEYKETSLVIMPGSSILGGLKWRFSAL